MNSAQKTEVKPRRATKPARVIGAPAGIAIKTRLILSERDERTLRALGSHLGALAGRDLVAVLGGQSWTARKQTLTSESSSRWAGTLTRANNDQVKLARMAQQAHRAELRAAIGAITRRLNLPCQDSPCALDDKGKKITSGYRDQGEHWLKAQRLKILQAELAWVETDLAAGKLHIVRGSKKLLKARHSLEDAGLTLDQWSERWWAARSKISANGSHDEPLGNLTIGVSSEGTCSILLPPSLRHLANDGHRYVLEARVKFSYRESDWKAQLAQNGALAYEISYDVRKSRWYLTASWTHASAESETVHNTSQFYVGVDLNSDHLACWLADPSGNPVGRPIDIPLILQGSRGLRDGHLRWAISRLLVFCKIQGAKTLFIEDLDFSDGKSRENFGHNKPFRHLISSFPTSQFKNRLQAMAARAGIELVAVDPAYTSKDTKSWIKPTSTKFQETTSHQGAALGISRRGLGLSLSRRKGVPQSHQRMTASELPTSSRNQPGSLSQGRSASQRQPGVSPSLPRPIAAYLRPPRTVRGGPLISNCQR